MQRRRTIVLRDVCLNRGRPSDIWANDYSTISSAQRIALEIPNMTGTPAVSLIILFVSFV